MSQTFVKETNNAGSQWPGGFVSLTNCPDGSYSLVLAQNGANYQWTWGTTNSANGAWPAGQVTITDPAQGTLVFQPDAAAPSSVGTDTIAVQTTDAATDPNTVEFSSLDNLEQVAQGSVSANLQTDVETIVQDSFTQGTTPLADLTELAAADNMSASDFATLYGKFSAQFPGISQATMQQAYQMAVSVANSTAGNAMALNSDRFIQLSQTARNISHLLSIPIRDAAGVCVAAAKLTGADADVLFNNLR